MHFPVLIRKGCTLDSFWDTHGGSFADCRFFPPYDTHEYRVHSYKLFPGGAELPNQAKAGKGKLLKFTDKYPFCLEEDART